MLKNSPLGITTMQFYTISFLFKNEIHQYLPFKNCKEKNTFTNTTMILLNFCQMNKFYCSRMKIVQRQLQ